MNGEEMDQDAAGLAPRDLLSQQIALRLRTMIATDALKPGERLRERTLAERLDVSRTPFREALKILESDGLVTLLPNRGAVVTVLSARDVQEKLDVLSVIEGFAGHQACLNASEQEIAEIRAQHHEMLAAYERRDRQTYFNINQAIHAAIVAAAHNRTLENVFRQINRQLFRYRYQGSVNTDIWHTAIDEHDRIIQMLSARDGENLSDLLRAHVSSTWRKIDWDALSLSRNTATPP
ncbi:MAG TPA: GntR family transcriptional regulator [Telmatospirillum sp.]|nr:GntR family transcriptional regulator [Telmatospirillum sp.]